MDRYRGVQSGWEKMCIGPTLERDKRRSKQDSVCKVAQGIYYGQKSIGNKGLLTEWDVNLDRVKTHDMINVSSNKPLVPESSSVQLRSSPICFETSSSGKCPLFFGSSSFVVERDEKALKSWKRRHGARHGAAVQWVQCGGK